MNTAYAQNVDGAATQAANLQMENAIELTIMSGVSNMDIEFNSLNDMINGVTTAKHQIRVRSNKKFKVTVKPSSNNFTYSGSSLIGTLMKVSNVMKIKVTDNQTGGSQPLVAQLLGWQSFSVLNTPVTLLTGCSAGGNQTFNIQYKATPGTNCVAGSYTTDMVYTATQE